MPIQFRFQFRDSSKALNLNFTDVIERG